MRHYFDEDRALVLRSQAGEQEAQARLLKKHRGICIATAKKFENQGMELDDLVQEAVYAFIKAIGCYDPERPIKFTTFASVVMMDKLNKALRSTGRTIRIPDYAHTIYRCLVRVSYQLRVQLGRDPTAEEIAAAIPDKYINKTYKPNAATVERIFTSFQAIVSLDSEPPQKKAFAEASHTFTDILPDENSEFDLNSFSDRQQLESLLCLLNERERYIIESIYGLNGPPRKFLEIGKALGITGQRVEQISRVAINKLRKQAGQRFEIAV